MLQRDAQRRRNLVGATLRKLRAVPADDGLAAFAEHLFAGGAGEDLAVYTADDLATLAASAWEFAATRPADGLKLRVYNPSTAAGDDALAGVTVVEALNGNMPFLLDSAMAELQDRGLDVRLVLHPIVTVRRDGKGRRTAFLGSEPPAGDSRATRESHIHIHIGRIEDDAAREDLAAALAEVFAEVRVVVADWRAMLERLDAAIAGYRTAPPPVPADDLAEAIQFLEWIRDNNFTFMGMRRYAYVGGDEDGRLERVEDETGAGLGTLRDPDLKVLRRGREFVSFTPEVREFLTRSEPLIVTKANVRSRVHRRVHLDYIGVKTFDENGRLSGELRIIGLFTSTAYNRSIRFIPYLRRKVDLVMRRAGFDLDSHSGKALMNVLDTFPRDELFQIDLDLLYEWALTILQLGERPRIRVLARADKFDRFVSVLVYVPRDRFNTAARLAIGDMLAEAFEGRVSAFYPSFPEGSLVRVHFIIGRYEGKTPAVDRDRLEAEVARIVRTWSDDLKDALANAHDVARAADLSRRYADAFDVAYQEAYPAAAAVGDAAIVERMGSARRLAISFHRPLSGAPDRIGLKLFRLGEPMPLSERVPILENMGFRVINERSFRIDRPGDDDEALVWLHDMVLERADGGTIDLATLDEPLEACFMAVATGRAENDGYNALVVRAGIAWRDIAMLRSMSRYLRQVRIPFSQDYMWQTLSRHAGVARHLVDLFHDRFRPDGRSAKKRQGDEAAIVKRIEAALEEVPSLDEDRILRRFTNAVRSTLRTNFFQADDAGQPKPTLAFKLDSAALDDLPEPRPFREIFVYSPRVEGVHLRFGRIARGGLRWSDRPQDFRTEVLGLVKAQQVKNAVIVPVGAKGGFVPKRLPAGDREAVFAEGTECYRIFVSSLLDITDNLDDGEVLPPDQVVRHDGDDPYLVVAADKGTATFSDTANAISESRHFWLGDAFASGGSAGYDHKKMGITARGGWEAVKRHFREMDVDIQTTPFTVIGCGDMSGDVFGNGMLLSKKIRLLAAFDHRDIFIDPDPDPAKSFAERERLFALPRSSWQDYSAKLISKGGGVFPRSLKAIPLSPEMQALLNLHRKSATPAEVINAILKSEADLLWFGGIGTYVRASGETDDAVGDRANDAVRITAADLCVKVIGEGANLGMTQNARVEFARRGGRVNSDAIDNSAGVNSSDMEVNIKIALAQVVRAGALTTPERNRLLSDMTGEVADLVLRNNYLQTLSLSLTQRRGLEDLGFQQRLMQDLEDRGLLDRAVEDLPDDAAIAAREERGEGLTRPEIAVLMAYAKIDLYDRLLDSSVPDDPYLARELMRYFPKRLQSRYPKAVESHQLRREIISTMLANSMINRGGPTMVMRMADEAGGELPEIAAAFAAARNAFALTELNTEIDALDNRIPGALQLELYSQVQDLTLGATTWFVRNADLSTGLAGIIGHYGKSIDRLVKGLAKTVPQSGAERIGLRRAELASAGVPDDLGDRLAVLPWLASAPDVVQVSDRTSKPLAAVAETYFTLGEHFRIPTLVAEARRLAIVDYYDRLALNRAVDMLGEAQRRLAAELLATGRKGRAALALWSETHTADVQRTEKAVAEIDRGPMTLARLAVAAGLLLDLAGE